MRNSINDFNQKLQDTENNVSESIKQNPLCEKNYLFVNVYGYLWIMFKHIFNFLHFRQMTYTTTRCTGLGGYPYVPGASGNIATGDVMYMLIGLNIETKINLPMHLNTANFISIKLQRQNLGRVEQAGIPSTQ